MMANLMHQDMVDDIAQALIILCPVVKDGPAIQGDPVRPFPGLRVPFLRQSPPFEQSEQIKGSFQSEIVDYIIVGKIRDANDDLAGQLAKFLRQLPVCLMRQSLEISQTGSVPVTPADLVTWVHITRHSLTFSRRYSDFPADLRERPLLLTVTSEIFRRKPAFQ